MRRFLYIFILLPLLFAASLTVAQPVQKRVATTDELLELFQNPPTQYRPFVRWWWNGNRIDSAELVRELRLLKSAGIGGVEINPVEFPARTDSLGIPALDWLSEPWLDMLRVTFNEAERLGLTCDLIVGSGWPFGGEFVSDSNRSTILMNYTQTYDGLCEVTLSEDSIFKLADPHVNSEYAGRQFSLMDLQLIPTPCTNLSNRTNLLALKGSDGLYHISIPDGHYTLSALVTIRGFMQVMNGAPGANGPVVDHYNRAAVKEYFNRMSSTIEKKLGKSLVSYLRAMFIDSFELEGANWNDHVVDEFQEWFAYDVRPYLPFILRKTRGMGDPVNYKDPVEIADAQRDTIERVRYDFEHYKALKLLMLLQDYSDWCHEHGVRSRAQAYGRNLFPLESSLYVDIPECESWTMTWTRHKLGEEMSEKDYRKGRAYTMVNKYVSSAAHLADKPIVSCEEMTNTYTVFNMTLQQLKIGGDQSAISGVTHSVFHGFNYSPQEAPFPGWIQYGAFYNERNNWWPHFHHYTDYKARLSAVLQNVTYQADIAILNPIGDMWSTIGMQNEPFPSTTIVPYKTFIWEAISKCGGNADYVTESILRQATIEDGLLKYNKSAYKLLILTNVERMSVDVARKVLDFARGGGRVLCIETIPHQSLGMQISPDYNIHQADSLVKYYFDWMQLIDSTGFIFAHKPDSNYLEWYDDLMHHYELPHAIDVRQPNPYLMQNHYLTEDGNDVFFFANANRYESVSTLVKLDMDMIYPKGRKPTSKNLYRLDLEKGTCELYPYCDNILSYCSGSPCDGNPFLQISLRPAESLMLVFKQSPDPFMVISRNAFGAEDVKKSIVHLDKGWKVEFYHSLLDSVWTTHMDTLKDLNKIDSLRTFTGTISYKHNLPVKSVKNRHISLDLGLVEGVAELYVNGVAVDTMCYGAKRQDIHPYLHKGNNEIEIRVTTTMGNYLKTWTDRPDVQHWVNRKGREQWWQPMGLIGTVNVYEYKIHSR